MDYYPYNRKVLKAYGLTSPPDRRTFDRRLSTISVDIKKRTAAMANLSVKEKIVDPYNALITKLDAALHSVEKDKVSACGHAFVNQVQGLAGNS